MSEEWERNEDGSIKLQLVKSLLTVMELVEAEDPTRPGLVRVPLALLAIEFDDEKYQRVRLQLGLGLEELSGLHDWTSALLSELEEKRKESPSQ